MTNLPRSKLRPFLLSFPIFIWLILFIWDFYPGRIILFADSARHFIYSNYYLNNLERGVFPMWDPFHAWGRPDDFGQRTLGEFNPFLYVIMFLKILGLPFSVAFFIFLVGYFLLGIFGFYGLSRRILKDDVPAYAGTLLLLFSSSGVNLINDILVILILVPTIWFFYFMVVFTDRPDKRPFWGLIFVSMIMGVTYIPLYFVTVFLVFLFCYVLLYFNELKNILRKYIFFMRANKLFVAFGLSCLLLSMLPALLWYWEGEKGEYLVSWRYYEEENANSFAMHLNTIVLSGLVGPNSLEGLFSGFKDIHADRVFIPFFAFIILCLGAVAPINKRLLLYLSISLIVSLISFGDVTPFYNSLFNIFGFLKYFRNLHFLFWLVFPVMVLFFAEQLKWLLSRADVKNKLKNIVFIVIAHMTVWAFLSVQENVGWTSFAVVVISFIFFLSYFTIEKESKRKSLFLLSLLILAIVLQPVQVFLYLGKNSRSHDFEYGRQPYTLQQSYPKFSYLRPLKGEDSPIKDDQEFGDVTDTSGFTEGNYVGIRSAFLLQKQFDQDILKNYVRYKFIVYDAAKSYSETQDAMLKDLFSLSSPVALLSTDEPTILGKEEGFPPQAIEGPTEEINVVDFDVNSIRIKTNFKVPGFLVYNDSYHSDWKGWINGQPIKLYKANIAFKGMWLPAGENMVVLKFRPGVRYGFNLFLLFLFQGAAFFLLWMYGHEAWKRRNESNIIEVKR